MKNKISDLIFSGHLQEATQYMVDAMKERLQEKAEEILVEQTQTDVDAFGFVDGNPDDLEKDAVLKIRARSRSLGGDEGFYQEGLYVCELRAKQAAQEFGDWLEDNPDVEGYEIEIRFNDTAIGVEKEKDYEFSEILDDRNFSYLVFVYLNPDLVQYQAYEIEEEIEDENGVIQEVTRKIKINFRGKKRIKMKCARGYKWDAEKRACVKISGSDLAQMRKSLRRAVLTKRSKGASYKARIVRKTRKAKRFRKMMGLSQ